jgi:hypothetical protein
MRRVATPGVGRRETREKSICSLDLPAVAGGIISQLSPNDSPGHPMPHDE